MAQLVNVNITGFDSTNNPTSAVALFDNHREVEALFENGSVTFNDPDGGVQAAPLVTITVAPNVLLNG